MRSGLFSSTSPSGYSACEDLPCALGLASAHVEMRDRAYGACGEGADQHAFLFRASDHRSRIGGALSHPEDHDVGLDRREVEIDAANASQFLGQEPRISV